MEHIKQKIGGLKKDIEETEKDLSRKEGVYSEMEKRLKGLGFKSVESASKWIESSKEVLEKEEKKIVADFEKLKKEYDL